MGEGDTLKMRRRAQKECAGGGAEGGWRMGGSDRVPCGWRGAAMSFRAMKEAASSAGGFALKFGGGGREGDARRALRVAVLAGEARESLFAGLAECGGAGGFELFGGAGDWLVGARVEPVAADIGAQTERVYREMLELVGARGRRIARVWNYVPRINAEAAEGLETYRVF